MADVRADGSGFVEGQVIGSRGARQTPLISAIRTLTRNHTNYYLTETERKFGQTTPVL